MKIINRISVFFSVAFQPLFMPFVGLLLMVLLNNTLNDVVPIETRKYIVIISLLLTVIIPAILFLFFFKMGWISDLNLTVRKERVMPTFIVSLLFFVLYYLVRNSPEISKDFVSILLGSIIGVLMANVVTVFWKISIHSLGVFGVVGSLVALFYAAKEPLPDVVYLFIAIAIIVGVSRIVLKRHTPMQVVVGAALGFLSPFLTSYFNLYI